MEALAHLQEKILLLLAIREAGITAAKVVDLFERLNNPLGFPCGRIVAGR